MPSITTHVLDTGLLRERITNIRVFDRNESGQEGPWVTFARMLTLRTPKHITEPDLGVPSLTPRSWFSAVHGEAAWDALTKSGRTGRRTSTGTDRCCSSLPRMAATSPTSCLKERCRG